MVTATTRGRDYLKDLKKRVAREFSLGYLTKDEFDEYCTHQDSLEKLLDKMEKRHIKLEEVAE